MADHTTKWILDFVNRVTDPVKQMMKDISSATSGFDDLGDSALRSEKDIKAAIVNTKKYFNELKGEIKENEDELNRLEKAFDDAAPGHMKVAAHKAFDEQKRKVEALREQLKGAEEDMKDLSGQLDKIEAKKESWAGLATGINQSLEIINKATESLDFAVQIKELETNIQRMTGLTGKALDEYVEKSQMIADLFDGDAMQIAKAANALTKQVGGSYKDNFELIEKGYKIGANVNGDFIDNLNEYASKFKESGLTVSQGIALMTSANQKGIFNDKAIDSIKEATMSLKEMDQTQIDALKGIGLKPQDIIGKTGIDAIKLISEKMKGQTEQARQKIMADIFKGAGEDAGVQFAEEISKINFDISSYPEVEQSGSGMKAFFSQIKTWAGQTFGDVAMYAQQISPMIQIVAGAIPIIQMLTKVTWLQNIATKAMTVATRLMSITIMGTPIGWIIAGIAALVAIVMVCWNKFEGFRKVVFRGWEMLKLFGNVIKDYVINRIKGLLSGIAGIGKAIWYLFNKEWGKAAEAATQGAADLFGVSATAKAVKQVREGTDEALAEADKKHAAYEANRKKKKEAEEAGFSVNQYVGTGPDGLSYSPAAAGKGNKSKKSSTESGLSISGKSGAANIKMTINNYFNVAKNVDINRLANEVAGKINDRFQDAVISIG